MTTATVEKQPALLDSPSGRPHSRPLPAGRRRRQAVLLIGLDLGTNKSCVLAGAPGSTDITVSKVVPSVVGYVKDGIVDGIITGNARILYGEEALSQMLHVDLVAPLAEGVISRPEAARDFMQHIRLLADPTGKADIRAVVGVPPTPASRPARTSGARPGHLLAHPPDSRALPRGARLPRRLPGQAAGLRRPGRQLALHRHRRRHERPLPRAGLFPDPRRPDQHPFAGDAIDELLFDELNRTYPNNGLSRITVREIKEAHAYVGPSRKPLDIKVVIGGKSRTLELGDAVGNACNTLIDKIYPALTTLIAAASSDSVVTLLQNIIITGGGSQIRGIDTVLQKRLTDDGYENPKVRLAGQDFQRYVAIGALKAARAARENQWQVLLG
jgi:rod shape-determining protein MreB